MAVVIIGAGIAGLVAARMLRHRDPVVIEAQPSLPNNHHAVLRFRTPTVGDVTGIPFRKVRVIKSSVPWRNPVADSLAYARKCTTEYRSDRSLPLTTEVVERWVAPPDFIERLARGVEVRYGEAYDLSFPYVDKVISTVPMPTLVQALGYQELEPKDFLYADGQVITATIADCEAYVSLYVPSPHLFLTRVSITGDHLMVEVPGSDLGRDDLEDQLLQAVNLLSVNHSDLSDVEFRSQRYAKILPIDEGKRRTFIHWASTIKGRAFSLGRFATWRPTLLADDLIKDVRVIESLLDSKSLGYDAERIERERT